MDLKLKIARDLAKAMEWLHCGTSPPVAHMDLNSFNVLIDLENPEAPVRVTDFGMAHLKKLGRNPDPARKPVRASLPPAHCRGGG